MNDWIKDDKFPLPHITDILDSLSSAMYFTHLGLQQSYDKVNLDPNSRKVTEFSISSGQNQMKRLPMWFKISSNAFSHVISIAILGLTYEKAFIYMNDIIVYGRQINLHNKNLVDVFEK